MDTDNLWLLWSLELAHEFFHGFFMGFSRVFAYYFGGEEESQPLGIQAWIGKGKIPDRGSKRICYCGAANISRLP